MEASVNYAYRIDNEYIRIVAVGESGGRIFEMIGEVINENRVLIYHAFTPPTRKVLHELGMI